MVSGSAQGFLRTFCLLLTLLSVNAKSKFGIYGATAGDTSGGFLSAAGDINNDGFLDVIYCASQASASGRAQAGIAYVIFGAASISQGVQENKLKDVNLATLNSTQGFKILGAAAGDAACTSAGGIGDVNGDGIHDIIIGAPMHDANSKVDAGAAYVIFGHSGSFADIDLIQMESTVGIKFSGETAGDWAGFSVNVQGNFNADSMNDLLIGAPGGDSSGSDGRTRPDVGRAYVVLGSSSLASTDLTKLQTSAGYKIYGNNSYDHAGYSVSATDVNNDGKSDPIIGAYNASAVVSSKSRSHCGVTYVLFSSVPVGEPIYSNVDLHTTFTGFRVFGAASNAISGYSVSALGDVNFDGKNDFMVMSDDSGETAIPVAVIYGRTANTDIDINSFTSSTGIRIYGGGNSTQFYYASNDGRAQCGVFDFNGDSFADIAVPVTFSKDGVEQPAIGVIFGSDSLQDTSIAALSPGSGNGFKIWGPTGLDTARILAASTGGSNDGYSGLMVSLPFADPYGRVAAGAANVFFGKGTTFGDLTVTYPAGAVAVTATPTRAPTAFPSARPTTSVPTVQPTIGPTASPTSVRATAQGQFGIHGSAAGEHAGHFVSSAGDLNGDGYEDMLICAEGNPFERKQAGITYVIYGGSVINAGVESKFSDINLGSYNSTQGFMILGAAAGDGSCASAASLGDVNGDGLDDIAIGAPYADPSQRKDAGAVYVIFGKHGKYTADINLAELPGSVGVKISGAAAVDNLGRSVSGVGDVNGDGLMDMVLGAPLADVSSFGDSGTVLLQDAGKAYVIFGKQTFVDIDLSTFSNTQGYTIFGDNAGDYLGWSVSGGGDINGDGRADLILGAYAATSNQRTQCGITYAVFSAAPVQGIVQNVDLSNAFSGFKVIGASRTDMSGYAVANLGDINGDSLADLVIAGKQLSSTVPVVVVYGTSSTSTVDLSTAQVLKISGDVTEAQASVFYLGNTLQRGTVDFNGDGLNDIIVTGLSSSEFASQPFAAVVFGGAALKNTQVQGMSPSTGFKMWGGTGLNNTAIAVATTSVNVDGYGDLLVSLPGANPYGSTEAGTTNVFFGKTTNFTDLTVSWPENTPTTTTDELSTGDVVAATVMSVVAATVIATNLAVAGSAGAAAGGAAGAGAGGASGASGAGSSGAGGGGGGGAGGGGSGAAAGGGGGGAGGGSGAAGGGGGSGAAGGGSGGAGGGGGSGGASSAASGGSSGHASGHGLSLGTHGLTLMSGQPTSWLNLILQYLKVVQRGRAVMAFGRRKYWAMKYFEGVAISAENEALLVKIRTFAADNPSRKDLETGNSSPALASPASPSSAMVLSSKSKQTSVTMLSDSEYAVSSKDLTCTDDDFSFIFRGRDLLELQDGEVKVKNYFHVPATKTDTAAYVELMSKPNHTVMAEEIGLAVRKKLAKTIQWKIESKQKFTKEAFMLTVLRLCEEIAVTRAVDAENWKKGCHVYVLEKVKSKFFEFMKLTAQRTVFGCVDTIGAFLIPCLLAAKIVHEFLCKLQRSFCNKDFLQHIAETGEFTMPEDASNNNIFEYVPALNILGLFKENATMLGTCCAKNYAETKGKFMRVPLNERDAKKKMPSEEEMWEMNRCNLDDYLPRILQSHGRTLSQMTSDLFWMCIRIALASVEMDWILDDWHDDADTCVEDIFKGKGPEDFEKYCRVTNRRFHYAMRRMAMQLKIKFFLSLLGMDWDHIA